MNYTPYYMQSQSYYVKHSSFEIDYYSLSEPYPYHRHDFVEIRLIASGQGREIINGVNYELSKGKMCVLLPWHAHEIIPDINDPLEIYKCSFNLELFLDYKNPYYELNDLILKSTKSEPICHLEISEFKKMIVLFQDIFKESNDSNLWADSLIKAKIAEMLIYFERCRNHESLSEINNEKNNIWKVIEYVHKTFRQDITLTDLSEKFHFSPYHLEKSIKQQTGLSLDGLVKEVRIRNACAFLPNPMANINTIAKFVGFKSPDSFCRAFKNIKGMSPEKYRKLNMTDIDNTNNFTRSVLNAQIVYYIHTHYRESITLKSLADEFYYNESYLSNMLNENGLSFSDLVHEIRIYHACSMLLEADLPINQIGFNIGFDSTETFYRIFKKIKGITPGEFRNKKIYEKQAIVGIKGNSKNSV